MGCGIAYDCVAGARRACCFLSCAHHCRSTTTDASCSSPQLASAKKGASGPAVKQKDPEYYRRFILEDLAPWKDHGITKVRLSEKAEGHRLRLPLHPTEYPSGFKRSKKGGGKSDVE